MMRKICALLIAAALLCACLGQAEGDVFADVAGTYELSSGVGAWYTELTVLPDGSFQGHYQDMDMGTGGVENGVPYDATLYCCDFSGRLTVPEHASAQELDCSVAELRYDEGAPYVEDGVLRVPSGPAGVNQGDALRFFMEGAYAEALPEAFLVWVRMREAEIRWETMPYRGLYNETADAGFSGVQAAAEPSAALWEFITAAPEAGEDKPGLPAVTQTPETDGTEGIEYPIQAEVVNCKTGVSLRAGPSTKAALLAEVPLGSLVTLHSNEAWLGNDRWFVDASYNGQRGYICVEYLDAILPEALRYQREYLRGLEGTVSAVNPGSDLILRAGPGTDYDSLGLLFGGEVLGYLGDAKQDASGTCWYHCSHYGEACWISAKFTALTLNDGRTYTGSRGVL